MCTSKTYQETTLKIRHKRCRMTICKFHKEMRGTRPHSSPRRDKPCMLRNDCGGQRIITSADQCCSFSDHFHLSLIINVTRDSDAIKISMWYYLTMKQIICGENVSLMDLSIAYKRGENGFAEGSKKR